MRNINACKEISKITKTSLGPNGNLKTTQNIYKLIKIISIFNKKKKMKRHEKDGY